MRDLFLAKIEDVFKKIKSPKSVAVGVSGGSDSMALTLLLAEFCKKNKIKFFALTVDHKIRQDSSEEALQLSKIFKKKKIAHHILAISDSKIPQKNIEAKLREARFELLSGFCKNNKIEALFLGHHRGDVAENFLIRLFRGSGLDGLSSISEVSKINEIKVVRPFLDFEKEQLQEFLRSENVEWFEDETNSDEKFLRNKIRNFLASFSEKKNIEKRIKNAADEIARTRDLFDQIMWRESSEAVFFEEKKVIICQEKFRQLDQKIALKILSLALIEVGGKAYKPRREKLERFYEYLIAPEKLKKRNFYNCQANLIDKDKVALTRLNAD